MRIAIVIACVLMAGVSEGKPNPDGAPPPAGFYHPADPSGGYRDEEIKDGLFHAQFSSPTPADLKGLESIADFRAAEICFAKGKRFPRYLGWTSGAAAGDEVSEGNLPSGGPYSASVFFSCLDSAHGLKITPQQIGKEAIPPGAADGMGAVKIESLLAGSPNQGLLQAGDVILEVNHHRAKNLLELTRQIDLAPNQNDVPLRIVRGQSVIAVHAKTADMTDTFRAIADNIVNISCAVPEIAKRLICLGRIAAGAAPPAAAAPAIAPAEHFDWECTMSWSGKSLVIAASDDGASFKLGLAEQAGEPLATLGAGDRAEGTRLVASPEELKSGKFSSAISAAGLDPAAVAQATIYLITFKGVWWVAHGLTVFKDKQGHVIGKSGFPQKLEDSLACGPSVALTRSDGPFKPTAHLAAAAIEPLQVNQLAVFGSNAYLYSDAGKSDSAGKKTFRIHRIQIHGDVISTAPLPALEVVWPTDGNLAAECQSPWSPSDDGKEIVFWASANSLRVIDADSGKLKEEIPFSEGDGCNVGFGHDARLVFQVGNNSQTRLWKRRAGQTAELLQTFRVLERTQYNSIWLAFPSGNRQVVVNDYFHGKLQFWDFEKRQYTPQVMAFDKLGVTPVRRVFFDSRGTQLLTKDMWRKYSGLVSLPSGTAQQLEEMQAPFGFSADDRFLIGAGPFGHPVVLDAASGKKIQEFTTVSTETGGVLADGRVIFWDGASGLSVWELPPRRSITKSSF